MRQTRCGLLNFRLNCLKFKQSSLLPDEFMFGVINAS